MNKLTAVLLGGAAAMLTLNAAQSTPIASAVAPAAQSYADLLKPVPNAVTALQADNASRAQQPKVELAQYRGHGHYYHHHHHHHGYFGGPGFGFGFFGGPYYGYDYDYGPPVVYGAPAGGDVAYCMRRYRSYDPSSGTYLGYDGVRHPCP